MEKGNLIKVDIMSRGGHFICTLSYEIPEGASFDPYALRDFVLSRLPTLKNERFQMVLY